jgi:hypothetical protein
LAAEKLDVWLRSKSELWAKFSAKFWHPLALLLCVANSVAMMYRIPLVLKEGMVNSTTRMSLERSIATELETIPANVPVMMALSAHVGAVQTAGRTLQSMVSEDDLQEFERALADPAHHAAYVIAIAGDPVAKAVEEHPAGLVETEVICTTGQPCAKVYQSLVWGAGAR